MKSSDERAQKFRAIGCVIFYLALGSAPGLNPAQGQGEQPQTSARIVVAKRTIWDGEVITPDMLRIAPSDNLSPDRAFHRINALVGRQARGAITAGTIITPANLLRPGMQGGKSPSPNGGLTGGSILSTPDILSAPPGERRSTQAAPPPTVGRGAALPNDIASQIERMTTRLHTAEDNYGTFGGQVYPIVCKLADLYMTSKTYDAAEPLFVRASDMLKKDPSLATTYGGRKMLQQYASLLRMHNQTPEANDLELQARGIR